MDAPPLRLTERYVNVIKAFASFNRLGGPCL